MSEELKKEAQDAELSLEDLTKIAGGTNSNTVDWGDPSKLPYTCPLCNATLTTREEVVGHLTAHVSDVLQKTQPSW